MLLWLQAWLAIMPQSCQAAGHAACSCKGMYS